MNCIRRLLETLAGQFTHEGQSTDGSDTMRADSPPTGTCGGHIVEFIGGPLDGRRELLDGFARRNLQVFLQIPITRAILDGVHPRKVSGKPTSQAVYELLAGDAGDLQYRFCGAAPPVESVGN